MALFLDSVYNVTCFQIRVSKLQADFWSPLNSTNDPLLFRWFYAFNVTTLLRENRGKSLFPYKQENLLFCLGGHVSVLQGVPEALTPGTNASAVQKDLQGNPRWSTLMINFDGRFWSINFLNIVHIYIFFFSSNKIMNVMVNLVGQLGSLSLRFFLQTKTWPNKNQLQRLLEGYKGMHWDIRV